MGIGSPDLRPSQSVIDAVKLALEDENAHQYQSYQGLPELKKVWLILFELWVTLNPNTEILPLMGLKKALCIFHWLF
jgi:aspartate/methionine/tyrosine aminotransferase